MIYLHEDGLRQVFQGKTSIDELRRVVNPVNRAEPSRAHPRIHRDPEESADGRHD